MLDREETKQLNKDLIEKYPFIKIDNEDCEFTWLDDLEPGWKKAFGLQLCEDLVEALKKDNCEDEFTFVQIKEKYGSLRLYAMGYGEYTKEVLAKYEELSTYICGSCGEPATHITTGWIYPVCSSCMKNINSKCVPIEEFYKFDSYKDILKEIENIKTNFKYDNYWK